MREHVIVVGAGPTGLMLAGWLARAGVKALVVDVKDGPTRETRALAVHARTLETYDMLGLGAKATAGGHVATAFNMWVGGQKQGRAAIFDHAHGVSPHPYVLILGQDQNEALLLAHLRAHGGEVAWQTELVGLVQADDGVTVTLRAADGTTRTVEADWVCGCDGASSTVRHALGVGFPGGTYQHRFYVADVTATGQLVPGEVNLCLDLARFTIFFPMTGANHWRVVGMLPDAVRERANVSFEDVRAEVEAAVPTSIDAVSWFSTYNVHHRVADHFQRGRVFLLGDAGHIHSPAGGQGMNTGLMDAANLAWKLALVAHGSADERLLASYAPERMPFARALVQTTDRIFAAITSTTDLAQFVRTRLAGPVFSLLGHVPAFQHGVFGLVSQTRVNYRGGPLSVGRLGGVQPGDRLPWVRFTHDLTNFDALLELAPRIHVYGEVPAGVDAWLLNHPSLAVVKFPFTPDVARVGLRLNAIYLVRPDGYVAYASLRFDPTELDSYLRDTWGFKL